MSKITYIYGKIVSSSSVSIPYKNRSPKSVYIDTNKIITIAPNYPIRKYING